MRSLILLGAFLAGLSSAEAAGETVVNWGLTPGAQPRTLCVFDTSGACVTAGSLNATTHLLTGTPSGLNISPPASSLAVGLRITQTVSGSTPIPLGNSLNLIYLPSDNGNFGAGFANGLAVSHTFGGAAMVGGRQAIFGYAQLSAATSVANTFRDYVGVNGTSVATSGDNGTNTGAGALGAVYGVAAWGDLQSGATNLQGVTGLESDVSIRTGGSAKFKFGILIASHTLDAVDAASYNVGLTVTAQTGSVKFQDGIIFSDVGTSAPIKVGGTLIRTDNSATVAHGIDFSSYTFSSDSFKSSGFLVGGTGNTTVRELLIPPATAPSAPATGWVIYTDSGDSNKLKAKASTGTTITLGTP